MIKIQCACPKRHQSQEKPWLSKCNRLEFLLYFSSMCLSSIPCCRNWAFQLSSGKTEYSPNHWSSRNCTYSKNCSAFARMRTSSTAHNWLHNPHSRDTSKAKCLKRSILRLLFNCRYGRSGCTLVLDRTKQNVRNICCGFKIHPPPFPV